jgi:ribose transport system ATP-binding protein
LDVSGLSKSFGPQLALADVELHVGTGEIHAVVGQNGSGKSTLVKILAGYHKPDPGALATVGGKPFELGSPAAAGEAGLRFVHQNLSLIDTMTVSDNFRLHEGPRRLGPLHRRAERGAAASAMARLGYQISPTALVSTLVESERTAVAVARALDHFKDVPLLVLDEPTAALPGPEAARLFEALRRVVQTRTSILFISHHLDEVMSLADRITILRDGRRVVTADVSDLSHSEIVDYMLGRQLTRATGKAERSSAQLQLPRLRIRDLEGQTACDLSFDVAPGEIVGIAGLTGSGREEVAGLLSGRLPRAGEITVDDVRVPMGRPGAAINASLCHVPADRTSLALLPGATVRQNLTIADLKPFTRMGRMSRKLERREVARWMDELDVRPSDGEKLVGELSGGNQQKVVMARWLRVAPAVLVLDEPTQGVDIGAKASIHELVISAARGGAAIILCSSDSEELARVSDRVLVMRRGGASTVLEGDDLCVERIEQEQLISTSPPSADGGKQETG